MKYTIPPGVFDILPNDEHDPWKNSHLWAYIEKVVRQIAKDYGYQEIRTPVFERSELFQRSVGETSDIVSKEMYTFEDKGGRSMSLRPEGTAPAMRAFVENQMHTKSPCTKLFYIGPMFRYERAQAGRYRQHHQFGAEVIGIRSPEQDAEVIDLLYTLYQRLGLQHLNLYLNSIGNLETRQNFRAALQSYLLPHFEKLSDDSKLRFHANPLRILDSKDAQDRELIAHAPSILDFLDPDSKAHFEELKQLLNLLKIPFKINPLLVRGLDYYNGTVFEVTAGELGAQNSLGGGGRFDGLLSMLGGPDLPAMGFGTGLERIIQTMLKQSCPFPIPDHPLLYLIPVGNPAKKVCFTMLQELRKHHIPAQMEFADRKVGKSIQLADALKARYVSIIGDEELEKKEIKLKEMSTGQETAITFEHLISALKTIMMQD